MLLRNEIPVPVTDSMVRCPPRGSSFLGSSLTALPLLGTTHHRVITFCHTLPSLFAIACRLVASFHRLITAYSSQDRLLLVTRFAKNTTSWLR